MSVRVLQSFPHRIGAERICTTAWHQAVGAAGAGAEVTLCTGAVARELPAGIRTQSTLARGRLRLPYRALGERAFALHDRIVARALPRLADEIDLVHVWPLAAASTLRAARRLGIPTVLERPNAHTRFAYEAVARECERIDVALPLRHEHAYNAARLAREEEEYALADNILCPSDFVVKSFLAHGFSERSLLRHTYGYDESLYWPAQQQQQHRAPAATPPLNALFVGVGAVRKGLHFALEAWLGSPASRHGRLRIAGELLPAYRARLAQMLAHPSIEALGHSHEVPELMRHSDILLLPSIEEGFGLVCVEAMACGCVPLVSDACTEVCVQSGAGLAHAVGDIDALRSQITLLDGDRARLAQMRARCLAAAGDHTWGRAGERLLAAYQEALIRARAPAQPAA